MTIKNNCVIFSKLPNYFLLRKGVIIIKENVTNQLKKVDISIRKKLFEISKQRKITMCPSPLQMKVIEYLLSHPKETVYQKTLEEDITVSKATISGALRTMENNQLIERDTSKKDGRAKKIILTEKGKKIYQEMEETFDILEEQLSNNISKKDLEQFMNTLKIMENNLEVKN